MHKEFSTGSPKAPSAEKESAVKILEEKILAAWGSARDQFKVPNNYRLAELFYKALYKPEKIETENIVGRPEFNRKETLAQKIDLGSEIVPSEEEFIQAIRRAATRETKFHNCLYPGALETLRDMAEIGNVTIWTRGDVLGVPEEGYPGSYEQLKRLAISGVGGIRKEVARSKGLERRDVVGVAASENKFSLLQSILDKYAQAGITKIFILDDQIKNISKAIEECKKHGEFELIPVWVRQGNYKNTIPKESQKTLDEWASELSAAESIAGLVNELKKRKLIKPEDGGKVGFIVDFDDVLLEDKKRKSEQVKAIFEMMQRKGWLNTDKINSK